MMIESATLANAHHMLTSRSLGVGDWSCLPQHRPQLQVARLAPLVRSGAPSEGSLVTTQELHMVEDAIFDLEHGYPVAARAVLVALRDAEHRSRVDVPLMPRQAASPGSAL